MNVQQVFIILRCHWRALAAGIGAIAAIAILYSVIAPKSYVARVSLVINGGDVNTVTGVQGFQQFVPTQATFLSTQADIITSHAVAAGVVGALSLDQDPVLRKQFEGEGAAGRSLRDWLADRLLRNSVVVEKSADSNVVTIATRSRDPVQAAALANAFATGYISTSVSIKADSARRQAQWLDGQVAAQRTNLQAKQLLLTQFQRSADVTDAQTGNNQVDIETARMNELSSQLALAQAARSDADGRFYQMRQAERSGSTGELADVSSNPVVQASKTDLNHAEAALAQANERFGSQHPQYLAAAAEVTKLKARLADEIASASGGIQQVSQQAARRESAIRGALDSQRARILSFKQKVDQRDVLSRDVEGAKVAYEAALARSSQLNMESRLDQSSIAVLSAATVPMAPSSPNLLRNLALALLLGLLCMPAAVLLVELRQRRIHDVADLGSFGVHLLGEIPGLSAAPALANRRKGSWSLGARPRILLAGTRQGARS
jgi:chain length determinant protein EpsF